MEAEAEKREGGGVNGGSDGRKRCRAEEGKRGRGQMR